MIFPEIIALSDMVPNTKTTIFLGPGKKVRLSRNLSQRPNLLENSGSLEMTVDLVQPSHNIIRFLYATYSTDRSRVDRPNEAGAIHIIGNRVLGGLCTSEVIDILNSKIMLPLFRMRLEVLPTVDIFNASEPRLWVNEDEWLFLHHEIAVILRNKGADRPWQGPNERLGDILADNSDNNNENDGD